MVWTSEAHRVGSSPFHLSSCDLVVSKAPIAFLTLTVATGSDCHGHARLGKYGTTSGGGVTVILKTASIFNAQPLLKKMFLLKSCLEKNEPLKTSTSDEYPHQHENKLPYFTRELWDFISAIPC